jgi:hypothetical protein
MARCGFWPSKQLIYRRGLGSFQLKVTWEEVLEDRRIFCGFSNLQQVVWTSGHRVFHTAGSYSRILMGRAIQTWYVLLYPNKAMLTLVYYTTLIVQKKLGKVKYLHNRGKNRCLKNKSRFSLFSEVCNGKILWVSKNKEFTIVSSNTPEF